MCVISSSMSFGLACSETRMLAFPALLLQRYLQNPKLSKHNAGCKCWPLPHLCTRGTVAWKSGLCFGGWELHPLCRCETGYPSLFFWVQQIYIVQRWPKETQDCGCSILNVLLAHTLVTRDITFRKWTQNFAVISKIVLPITPTHCLYTKDNAVSSCSSGWECCPCDPPLSTCVSSSLVGGRVFQVFFKGALKGTSVCVHQPGPCASPIHCKYLLFYPTILHRGTNMLWQCDSVLHCRLKYRLPLWAPSRDNVNILFVTIFQRINMTIVHKLPRC